MELESTEKPYIDFYDKHKISPVSQDISDISIHFDRRSSLYRHLGIVPSFISGKSIIEFGPGSGHNAIYTNSLRPARYVLVDANPTGLYHTKELLTQYATSSTLNFKIVDSLIEDYKDENSYDLVICECVIPRQNDPFEFLKKISQFVTTGGVLIITCVDSISWFSESLRRIFAYLIMDKIGNNDSLAKKLDILRPFFEIQLKSLIHMSRPIDDWIMDSILNPLNGNLLPIPDAIKTLKQEFDIYGSSPNFFTDWRWYKGLYGRYKSFNESAIDMYYFNAHNLLDYRYVFPQRPIEKNKYLINLCNKIIKYQVEFQSNRSFKTVSSILQILEEIIDEVDSFSSEASASVNDYICALRYYLEHNKVPSLDRFIHFWGRGIQYLSFIKKS